MLRREGNSGGVRNCKAVAVKSVRSKHESRASPSKRNLHKFRFLSVLIFSAILISSCNSNNPSSHVNVSSTDALLISSITLSQSCPAIKSGTNEYKKGLSFGIAFDGVNLWVSCYGTGSANDLLKVNPKDGSVLASYRIDGGLGALAYDAPDSTLFAGWGGGAAADKGKIWKIPLSGDAPSAPLFGYGNYSSFSACSGIGCPTNLDDGLAFDASMSVLYVEPENSKSIGTYQTNGKYDGSFTSLVAGGTCQPSGISTGGAVILESSDSCNRVIGVTKPEGSGSIEINLTLSGVGDEEVTCDPVTFDLNGAQVIWTSSDPGNELKAYKVPLGTCGFGGMDAPSSPFTYTALGDSYSSGEGVEPFLAGTNTSSDQCHRSLYAYSQLLARSAGIRPSFWACSGAVTADVLTRQYQSEPPQISQPSVANGPNLLTISIGGNDAGFGPIARYCMKTTGEVRSKKKGATDCALDNVYVTKIENQIKAVEPNLVTTFNALRAKTVQKQTSIIALDYPQIFPPTTAQQSCTTLSYFLSTDDQAWFRKLTDMLDSEEAQAAKSAGINFVDVRPNFVGHAVCDTNPSYFFPVVLTNTVYSFHPNQQGQEVYYQSLKSFIDSSRKNNVPLNNAGFPLDPAPGS